MATSQDPPELRAKLRNLPDREQKIVVALIAAMIDQSDRVRDREWVSEQFTNTVGLALDVGSDPDLESGPQGMARVQEYIAANAADLLPLAFGVFGQVALTLQREGGEITAARAMREVVRYVADEPDVKDAKEG